VRCGQRRQPASPARNTRPTLTHPTFTRPILTHTCPAAAAAAALALTPRVVLLGESAQVVKVYGGL
jgi:hypothetical protein